MNYELRAVWLDYSGRISGAENMGQVSTLKNKPKMLHYLTVHFKNVIIHFNHKLIWCDLQYWAMAASYKLL